MAEHFEAWSSCFNLSVVAWLHLTSDWQCLAPCIAIRNSVPSSVISFHSIFHCHTLIFSHFPSKKLLLFFSNSLRFRLAPRQRHGTPDPASPAPVVSAQHGPPDSGTILLKNSRTFWYHRYLFWGVVIVMFKKNHF